MDMEGEKGPMRAVEAVVESERIRVEWIWREDASGCRKSGEVWKESNKIGSRKEGNVEGENANPDKKYCKSEDGSREYWSGSV